MPTLNLNIERWKWNSEFRIYVSNMGNFKDEHKKNIPIKIHSRSGYAKIKTAYGLKSAHRLVLLTWKPIPNAEDLTVDHLDHNKRNNRLSNLEWVTQKENSSRAAVALCDSEMDKEEAAISRAPKSHRIRCGKNTFENIDDALAWLVKSGFLKKDGDWSKENVIKKIENAIKSNSLYCGRKWKYVN